MNPSFYQFHVQHASQDNRESIHLYINTRSLCTVRWLLMACEIGLPFQLCQMKHGFEQENET